MLNPSMKAAIKYGLALILAMFCSMWLGWSKTSWSMLTVTVLATLEIYGYWAQKSRNRLYGTVLGTAVAFLLIGLFAQERVMFIASITAFLWICVYYQSHRTLGYMFNIAITVCLIVSSSISAESASVINTAILRMQQTMLGIVVFSFVYKFVWPTSTDEAYIDEAQAGMKELQELSIELKKEALDVERVSDLAGKLKKHADNVKTLLSLPVEYSDFLSHHRERVVALVAAIDNASKIASQLCSDKNQKISRLDMEVFDELVEEVRSFVESRGSVQLHHINKGSLSSLSRMSLPREKRLYFANIAACVTVSAFMLWIYMPVPNGVLFPTLAGVLAANVLTIPGKAVKYIMLFYAITASFLLLQYVFVMPELTEAWQILLLYFCNAVLLWRLCDYLKLSPLKALAGNILVNIPASAVGLVPSYDVQGPLNMILLLFMSLLLIEFYAKVFSIKA
ncbi:hypothetical protein GT360_15020 [Vibrio astriarenae]|uniref:FUSC family protein n=1 Tax=Vibrio astriarenae TaxID=1481923 RepID=A0A7Z2T5Y1_9VIBR|nr:FUSC family protein [Vibrio astriarenae]QIA64875.1 hypothetical protein GT360_15020 [Vibrio astriarenae]